LSGSSSLICWQLEIMSNKWFVHWNNITTVKDKARIILTSSGWIVKSYRSFGSHVWWLNLWDWRL
jgi:hypothetical protein